MVYKRVEECNKMDKTAKTMTTMMVNLKINLKMNLRKKSAIKLKNKKSKICMKLKPNM